VERDRSDRQQGKPDRGRDADRRPDQSDEHARDAGEFACTDESPLQGFDSEVVADRQRPRDAEQLDARGEREERREEQGHY
jgi:hypothetical protein